MGWVVMMAGVGGIELHLNKGILGRDAGSNVVHDGEKGNPVQ